MSAMKIYIVFLFFFFFTISCQTVKSPSGGTGKGRSAETASDILDEESSDGEFAEEDLEEEFADSEDFEKEMADEAFPSDDKGQATAEVEQEEKEESDKAESPDETDLAESPDETDLAESPDETDLAESPELIDDDDLDIEAEEGEEKPPADSIGGAEVVINSIRYESKDNKIYINGTGSFSYQPRENKANNQFVIEIPGAVLSESLQERPFIMKDFNTDMAFLQADQKDSNTVRVVLQMRENAGMPSVQVADIGSLVISSGGEAYTGSDEFASSTTDDGDDGGSFSSQSTNETSKEVLPAKTLEEFFLHTPQFTGRPISIHFKDVNVREVLYFISEGTGLNMVLSEDVQGSISIKLRNVPWDQALVTVMKTKKLGYIREGNVIRIMNLDKLKEEQKGIQDMLDKQKVLDPLKVKVIPVIYTKVADMAKQVKDLLTKDRGKVTTDTQSNSLIITDTARTIERIEIMIKHLDKTPTQVMIEAKIVEARESFVRNLGISWGFQGAPLNITIPSTGKNPPLALDISGGLNFLGDGQQVSSASTLVTRGLKVSFSPVGDLDLALGLSEIENLIHVLSAPRIMVLNGEKATISQSTEDIDIDTTVTQEGTQRSPKRIQADLKFDVSPTITSVGSIYMEIDMKREFFGAQQTVGDGTARPKNSRTAKTKVLVNNGQTIVIGGIYQKDSARSDEGMPLLRHIPILKWFFSTLAKSEQRNELLLFLTPRIVDFAGGSKPQEIN